MSQLATQTTTEIMMTEEEARTCVEQINQNLANVRALLLELHEREGWRALGYDSWSQCVQAEFGDRHRSYLYRQLDAARIEAGSDRIGVGDLPESHLRVIASALRGDNEGAKLAVGRALDEGAETADDFKRAAQEVWVERHLPRQSTLRARCRAGTVSVYDAYHIGGLMDSLDADERQTLMVLDQCTDTELAAMLLRVKDDKPDLWDEIVATVSIPTPGENTPLAHATGSTLDALLDIESAEARARHIERNRDYYDRVRQAERAIIEHARTLVDDMLERDVEMPAVLQPLADALDELDKILDEER